MDILDGAMKLREVKDLESLKQNVLELAQTLSKKGLWKDSYIYETSDRSENLMAKWALEGKIDTWKMEDKEREDFERKVDLLVTIQFYEEVLAKAEQTV